jgi:D-alanine transaminase
MARISYVNDSYVDHNQAVVSIEDRGYQFADGVYEVVYIKDGTLIDWSEHMLRLRHSLDGLRIAYDVDAEGLKQIVDTLLEKNALTDATVYMQITRGVAPRDHQFPSTPVDPAVVMTMSPLKPLSAEQYENGIKAITYPDMRWKRRDFKTIALLPNALAKQEAVESGATEAILVDEDTKFVTEGSATNVFLLTPENILMTHPATERILHGITRAGVLQVAKEQAIAVKEEAFTAQQLRDAKEVFITSTTKHILPITTIDEKQVGEGKAGEVTKRLMEAYQGYIARQL